jgi:glycosyltransferase involved in cell wall biosynthesis
MDVVQVNHLHRPSLGGIENYSHRLAGSLRDRGHDVSVFTTDASLDNDTSPLAVDPDVTYCRTLAAPFRNPLSVELYRRVRETSADLYHLHSPWYLTSMAATLAIPREAPVVMTVHGFQPIQGLVGQALETAYKPFARRILDRVDRVIVLGVPERRRLIDEYGVDPSRVVVVPNGIVTADRLVAPAAVDAFRRRYDLDPTVPTVLCVSRLVPLKRPDLLVDAVVDHLPDTPVQVVIVGHGDSAYAASLQARADDRVRFLSNLSDEELLAAYAAADVFALLSAAEGLPTVVLEAMTAGLPVVATPAGALADVIVDGVNGRLLSADPTAEEVASTLADLLADPAELAAIGERNRRTAHETFEWELIAEAILGIYEAAIGERRSKLGGTPGGGDRSAAGPGPGPDPDPDPDRTPPSESDGQRAVVAEGPRPRSPSGDDPDDSTAAGHSRGNGADAEADGDDTRGDPSRGDNLSSA